MIVDDGHLPNGSKRAVLYARVSTEEQAEKGYSLPTQLEAMRKYAAEQGFRVPSPEYEIHDDHSGAKLDRPGLDKARAMLEAGEAEIIIVHTADRLSRNLAHSLILRENFQRLGVELHYVDRGKAQNTAESRLTQNVEAVIAEYEREKIKERTRRGLRAKAQAGKWVGHSPEPYGYRREGRKQDTRLVIDPAESEVVRRIFALYTGANRHQPSPLRVIAELFNLEGIPSPGRWTKSGRGPGKGWYIKTLKEILSRRVYIGELESQGEIIPKPELAIIDRAVFNKAQAQREKNQARASRNSRHDYLLTGHLQCLCGYRMSGKSVIAARGRRNLYYRCLSTVHVNSLRKCREGYVRCDIADTIIWDWLSGLFTNPDKFHQGLADYQPSLRRNTNN